MNEHLEPNVGTVVDVQGDTFVAELSDVSLEGPPVVTIGDEDIILGRVGSYLLVTQGELRILTIVTRMIEHEKFQPLSDTAVASGVIAEPYAQRMIHLITLGSLSIEENRFERGVSSYPSTGAEVRAVSSNQLKSMFEKYISKNYDVGHHSAFPSLRVYLDPTSLFGRHMAILGQTGAGKSWTVATLLQKAV